MDPTIDTLRCVYVPTEGKKRAWLRSWIYEEAHIQICVRNPKNILAVWHVQADGSYGKERPSDDLGGEINQGSDQEDQSDDA